MHETPPSPDPESTDSAATRAGGPARRVPLNLVYDYPVRWSKYKVLRDLIQNFFDSIPRAEWHRRLDHRLLGESLILTLEAVCEAYDGFAVPRAPTGAEPSRIAIPESLAKTLLGDLIEQVGLPPCRVIGNVFAAWQGMTTCIPLDGAGDSWRGLTLRYYLPYVAVDETFSVVRVPAILAFTPSPQRCGTGLQTQSRRPARFRQAAFAVSRHPRQVPGRRHRTSAARRPCVPGGCRR